MADPHATTDHADHDAAAYQHGKMEITEQAATYSAFMVLSKWGALAIACALLFLVLWFQQGGSFIAGLGAAVVLAVVGFFALKSKRAH
ncbi:MAG: aa3-type cytochrome c oxidase subunit IV [Brevundimonas sp.]|nr:MAG: aa3-type cytochrome c oxidase subunit IV [Brevundimonas sp.]